MRYVMCLFIGLVMCPAASAQNPYGHLGTVQVLGPYQPNPYGGYYYHNPTFPYRGPVGYAPDYVLIRADVWDRPARYDWPTRRPYRRW